MVLKFTMADAQVMYFPYAASDVWRAHSWSGHFELSTDAASRLREKQVERDKLQLASAQAFSWRRQCVPTKPETGEQK